MFHSVSKIRQIERRIFFYLAFQQFLSLCIKFRKLLIPKAVHIVGGQLLIFFQDDHITHRQGMPGIVCRMVCIEFCIQGFQGIPFLQFISVNELIIGAVHSDALFLQVSHSHKTIIRPVPVLTELINPISVLFALEKRCFLMTLGFSLDFLHTFYHLINKLSGNSANRIHRSAKLFHILITTPSGNIGKGIF